MNDSARQRPGKGKPGSPMIERRSGSDRRGDEDRRREVRRAGDAGCGGEQKVAVKSRAERADGARSVRPYGFRSFEDRRYGLGRRTDADRRDPAQPPPAVRLGRAPRRALPADDKKPR